MPVTWPSAATSVGVFITDESSASVTSVKLYFTLLKMMQIYLRIFGPIDQIPGLPGSNKNYFTTIPPSSDFESKEKEKEQDVATGIFQQL